MHMGTQEVLRHRGGGLDGTYNLWKIKKRFQKTNIIIYLYNDNELADIPKKHSHSGHPMCNEATCEKSVKNICIYFVTYYLKGWRP